MNQGNSKRPKKIWIVVAVVLPVLAVISYFNHSESIVTQAPPERLWLEVDPVMPVKHIDARPSTDAKINNQLEYKVKESPKGTVKIEINNKPVVYLISDLQPFPCPSSKGKICLHLKDGNFIEANSELRKKLPDNYQYYIQHMGNH